MKEYKVINSNIRDDGIRNITIGNARTRNRKLNTTEQLLKLSDLIIQEAPIEQVNEFIDKLGNDNNTMNLFSDIKQPLNNIQVCALWMLYSSQTGFNHETVDDFKLMICTYYNIGIQDLPLHLSSENESIIHDLMAHNEQINVDNDHVNINMDLINSKLAFLKSLVELTHSNDINLNSNLSEIEHRIMNEENEPLQLRLTCLLISKLSEIYVSNPSILTSRHLKFIIDIIITANIDAELNYEPSRDLTKLKQTPSLLLCTALLFGNHSAGDGGSLEFFICNAINALAPNDKSFVIGNLVEHLC